jgi:hypothetical protein
MFQVGSFRGTVMSLKFGSDGTRNTILTRNVLLNLKRKFSVASQRKPKIKPKDKRGGPRKIPKGHKWIFEKKPPPRTKRAPRESMSKPRPCKKTKWVSVPPSWAPTPPA